jgi:hypothetical protein
MSDTQEEKTFTDDFQINFNDDTFLKNQTYIIKSFYNGKFFDVYDGILDLSTDVGKNEFNFLKKIIIKNNWLVIPSFLYKKYEIASISLNELKEDINVIHEKLGLPKPNLTNLNLTKEEQIKEEKINNDFISNVSDIEPSAEIKNLTANDNIKSNIAVSNDEAVKVRPSDIANEFNIYVKNKLNELYYHRNRVENTKGKVSLKSLLTAGGVFAFGVVFTPLSAITVPTAIAIGGYAVLKSIFEKNPEIKNYDKQIEALQEATAKMVLKETNEDTKENIKTFIKNHKNLESALFDDKIESEFARICKLRNIKIDYNIFRNAAQYENGHVLEYNKNVKKVKF